MNSILDQLIGSHLVGSKLSGMHPENNRTPETLKAGIKAVILDIIGEDDDTSHAHMLAFKKDLRAEQRARMEAL